MYAAPFFFSFSVVSCIPSCENTIKGEITNHHQGFVSEVISWNSSTFFLFSVCIEALDLVIKGFFEKTTSEREEFRMNVLLKFMHRTLKMYFKPLDNVQKRAFIFNDVKLIVVFEKKKKKKKMTSSQSTGRTKV